MLSQLINIGICENYSKHFQPTDCDYEWNQHEFLLFPSIKMQLKNSQNKIKWKIHAESASTLNQKLKSSCHTNAMHNMFFVLQKIPFCSRFHNILLKFMHVMCAWDCLKSIKSDFRKLTLSFNEPIFYCVRMHFSHFIYDHFP